MEITLLFCLLAGLVLLGVLVWTRSGASKTAPTDFAPISGELAKFGERLNAFGLRVDQSDAAIRKDGHERDERQRRETADALQRAANSQREGLDGFSTRLTVLAQSFDFRSAESAAAQEQRFLVLRKEVSDQLVGLRAENQTKLTEIQGVVNEQLQKSLETRLGAAFEEVNKRLLEVHQGLGEMQRLAQDVGNLNRTLTNVKTRGIFGELQLEALLTDVLSATQFEKNVRVKSNSRDVVEFAVKLPGQEEGKPVWLPIDSKFPREDYDRLVDAASRGDEETVKTASKALEDCVLACAREIHDKYISPPETTDFAIMFVPTEGLYAEIARRHGLLERVNRDFKITITGPSTLGMLLNALYMGFRTLAVQKQSAQVWNLLAAVRTQFSKFGETLDKVQQTLETAQRHVAASKQRASVIANRLTNADVPLLTDAQSKLELPDGAEGTSTPIEE